MAIDELLHSCIIHEISSDSFDFTYDLLRQAAFSGLSMAHRRLLHRKVAEAYVQLDQSVIRLRHAEVASHYEQASLAVQAVTQYRLAAESAADIFANSNAWDHLQRAVELAESVGVGDQREISFEDFAMILEKAGHSTGILSHQSITPAYVFVSMLANQGYDNIFFGDSGGPDFVQVNGAEQLIAINISANSASCEQQGTLYRLDTPSAREFLSQFVTLQ